LIYDLHAYIAEIGIRRGIDRKKVECRSLIDANLEGQVGVNKFEQYQVMRLVAVYVSYHLSIMMQHNRPIIRNWLLMEKPRLARGTNND